MGRGKRAVAFSVIIVAVVLAAVAFVATRYQNTSAERLADAYDGSAILASSASQAHDADGDGVPDGPDILQGTLEYVASQPSYGSGYYVGGRPNDGQGVCVDLLDAGLLAAGYDLRDLVARDVAASPGAYDIDSPDPDIDYRRVRNLRVYFERNAEALTLDLTDVAAWQLGDIAVFENHVGVVSDRRNARGVPYVIHHEGPWQAAFEQDILESRRDLAGHYRMCP